MRNNDQAVTISRDHYLPPTHWVKKVFMRVELSPQDTCVITELHFEQNPHFPWALAQSLADKGVAAACTLTTHGRNDWRLLGEDLLLDEVALNGAALQAGQYAQDENGLWVKDLPEHGVLKTRVRIHPVQNTRLEGLYQSNGNYFTQCEAEGFRRITFYPDRPDVMAEFEVTVVGSQADTPILLSNGNLVEQGVLDNGQHFARWHDPFPKPCYLFALVAGTLVCQEHTLVRKSGKPALLQVWVEPGQLDKTDHAMQSLIHSIRWDEERFGLELDLDRFMIVAVGDFNMGAMENKGLNIFNTKFVLANPQVGTDVDYDNVESVVAHEYFHNWTGNRVTCRDWFQLSLKEGLTVFRDQEFTADMMARGLDEAQARSARAVKRIGDVKVLRAAQFPEDAGPMAHPIRPDQYQEINNFYTVTVYEKGAEVVRMQQTLLGREGFRRGMDLYFQRHDGQAVTCDDFVNAMETALQETHPDKNLQQFRRWYSQAGTPTVHAQGQYDAAQQRYTLTLRQQCAATPGQPQKAPFHIPFAVGLLDNAGQDLPLHLTGEPVPRGTTRVLDLTLAEQVFVFEHVPTAPVPSLLRGFSAPVRVEQSQTEQELLFLLRHDSDPFNRWEAGQRLYSRIILGLAAGTLSAPPASLHQAVDALLSDETLSHAYKALVLALPSEGTLAEQVAGVVDPQALHSARKQVKKAMAAPFVDAWTRQVDALQDYGAYNPSSTEVGKRSMKNLALDMLGTLGQFEQAQQQFEQAQHMTDRMAALTVLVHNHAPTAQAALDRFEADWTHEALVMDKWFTVQATQPEANAGEQLQRIEQLSQHPAFSMTNPNKVRSLISAFCHSNPGAFHQADGSGYAFWARSVIRLNSINPQVASRLARALDRWTRFADPYRAHMHSALQNVADAPGLSPDVAEIVGKALAH